jgi:hypothetical protein
LLQSSPRNRYFVRSENGDAEVGRLLGQLCVISTSEVTGKNGQAKLHTEGAPLLLHVRTREGKRLRKGDLARIVDFDPANLIYYVEKLQQEVDV